MVGGGGEGGKFVPPNHTKVCKILRLSRAVSSIISDITLSKSANFLILRRSFYQCRSIFANWSLSKVEKKHSGVNFRVFSY